MRQRRPAAATTGQAPDYAKALAGAPKPLAELYDQADQLLPGGADAFQQRLDELRGHPVVVNKWASWCGPCREEMPWLQREARPAREADRLHRGGLEGLGRGGQGVPERVPGPVSRATPIPVRTSPGLIDATIGIPATAFYDSSGKQVYVQQGQYASQDALAADIQRYAR